MEILSFKTQSFYLILNHRKPHVVAFFRAVWNLIIMKVSQTYIHILLIYLCFNLETEYFKKMKEVTSWISSSTLLDSMQNTRTIKLIKNIVHGFPTMIISQFFVRVRKVNIWRGKKCLTCAQVHPTLYVVLVIKVIHCFCWRSGLMLELRKRISYFFWEILLWNLLRTAWQTNLFEEICMHFYWIVNVLVSTSNIKIVLTQQW